MRRFSDADPTNIDLNHDLMMITVGALIQRNETATDVSAEDLIRIDTVIEKLKKIDPDKGFPPAP